MVDEINLDQVDTQKVGAIAAGRIESAAERNLEVLSRTSSWLTASLLAINGGGAIAAMNVAERLDHPNIIGSLFVLGIGFAMLNAVVIQGLADKLNGPIENWLAYWRSVERYGERRPEGEAELHAEILTIERYRWLAPTVGWASGLLFIAGVIAVGFNLHVPAPPDGAACATLKHEMLSASQRIKDAAASYAALGCAKL